MIRAVLSNPAHPEYGVVTIPFPIPHDQYAHCMRTRDELIQTADEIDAMMTCDCELRLLGECLPREELVFLLEQDKQGIDKRCTITTALKDPDAADGAEERYSVDNVAFTELPFMNYKMGEVNQQKLPFTFRPSDLQCLDRIQAAD